MCSSDLEYRQCCQPSVSLMKIGIQVSCHSFSMSEHRPGLHSSVFFSLGLITKGRTLFIQAARPGWGVCEWGESVRPEGERERERGREREQDRQGKGGGGREKVFERERGREEERTRNTYREDKHFFTGWKDSWSTA